MIKKAINSLNQHRLLLIRIILLLIIITFLSINSYLFLHHKFQALTCTEKIDEEYCYHNDIKILKNPQSSQEAFFKKYDDEISELQEKYHLDEFNFYTAYYYLVASRLNYTINNEYKIMEEFFEAYTNTYDLEQFYFKNNFYFSLFYNYKIS